MSYSSGGIRRLEGGTRIREVFFPLGFGELGGIEGHVWVDVVRMPSP